MSRRCIVVKIHFVWSTKRRIPWLGPACRPRLYSYIRGIIRAKGGCLIAAGGVEDHLHLYVGLPANVSMAVLVNAIKSNSSRWLRANFADCENFRWQRGYGAFSVNPRDDRRLIAYIGDQERRHAGKSFRWEYLRLVERYGLSPSEEIWE